MDFSTRSVPKYRHLWRGASKIARVFIPDEVMPTRQLAANAGRDDSHALLAHHLPIIKWAAAAWRQKPVVPCTCRRYGNGAHTEYAVLEFYCESLGGW